MDRNLLPAPRNRKSLLLHGAIAAMAVAPILALISFTPDSWWRRNGFETYPGTYIRLSANDYRLCRPWGRSSPPRPKDPAIRMTERHGSVMGPAESNFAVLLPATARVDAIYCGAALSPGRLSECSGNRCALKLHTIIDDGQYTGGRGIIFGVQAKDALPTQRTDVGFWVLWSDGTSRS